MVTFETMKIYTLLALFLFLNYNALSQENIIDDSIENEDINKLLGKGFLSNKNAVYFNLADLFVKQIQFGFQRHIYKNYWAEVGYGFGLKTISNPEEDISKQMSSPLRYMYNPISKLFSKDAVNLGHMEEEKYSIKQNSNFDLGLYKKVFGFPLTGQWSYGLKLGYTNYDITYSYSRYDTLIQNTLTRINIQPSIIYKAILYKNIGMDYGASFGTSLLRFGDSGKSYDELIKKSTSTLDYNLLIKIYFTF